MAARKQPKNRDSSNKLAGATQLLNRLIMHANGKCEMSATQVNAAKIVIGKYIPDLKAVELSMDQDKPFAFNVGLPWLSQQIQARNSA